jgi:hypothetical protein
MKAKFITFIQLDDEFKLAEAKRHLYNSNYNKGNF